ncbi:MAG: hypothetical protein HQ557_04235 [Bacteroidetes bacterium]|nr:hypothetical protein [Bacteroidota bacterium]
MKILDLSGVLTIGCMESSVKEYYQNNNNTFSEGLLINLSSCEYIEIASLTYLLSFIKNRSLHNLSTILKLPTKKDVRDFLRTWDFQKSFDFATGLRFRDCVTKDDLKYFGENTSPRSDNKYLSKTTLDGRTRLVSNKFFSFRILFHDPGKLRSNEIIYEVKRWEESLVLATLKRYLNKDSQFLASRIIFESLTNAATHPKANLAIIASHVDKRNDSKSTCGKGFFTLVLWDDGISMIDTLKKAIQSGSKIKNSEIYEPKFTIFEKIENASGKSSQPVESTYIPDSSSDDDLLFLSTTLPGITSDPLGLSHLVLNHSNKEADLKPGIGLFILVKTVIEEYSGSISFRSNNYFMNIKAPTSVVKSRHNARFQVKIKKYSDNIPSFLGNMITIRLPFEV